MPGVSSADSKQVPQVLGGGSALFHEVPQGSGSRGRFMTSCAHFLTKGMSWGCLRFQVASAPRDPSG